jgi:uncharacterized protein YbjT (DUF2867 family)
MTSIGVSRLGAYSGSTAQLLNWKRRSERLVRASGLPYTVVRPGWFDATGPGDGRIVLEQGDTGNGGIGRDQVAEVLVRSLLSHAAVNRTFGLFAPLTADTAGGLDAAHDPDALPALDQEPEIVRADVTSLHRA